MDALKLTFARGLMTTKILYADTDYDLKLITGKIKNTETKANILQKHHSKFNNDHMTCY